MTDGEHYRAIKEALSALRAGLDRAKSAGLTVSLSVPPEPPLNTTSFPPPQPKDICADLHRASLSITRTVKDDTP